MNILRQRAESMFGNKTSNSALPIFDANMKKVMATRQKIHDRSIKAIEFSRPIISRGNMGIIYPNTIAVVQGKKGVHKSRLSETLCICLLHINQAICQIGFSRELLKNFSYARLRDR